jgi:hypothetical protein
VGARGHVLHFGGGREEVTIVEVREGGRYVVVAGADGERDEFTLSRGTASFVRAGDAHGARLVLTGP